MGIPFPPAAAAAVLVATLFQAGFCSAADTAVASPPAAEEALLKQLEQSGALDRAVERAINRYVQRQNEARKKVQEEAETRARELAARARAVDPARDHVWGDAKAPVSIIEYSDFECPFCKTFYGTPEEVVKRLAGKANFVWRQFPLPMHGTVAAREALAVECAGRIGGHNAFWGYARDIMRRTRSNGQGLPGSEHDPLLALAEEHQLDGGAFAKCLDSAEAGQMVAEDTKDGEGAGISGTPGVIVRNNKTGRTLLVGGAILADQLETRVRELLTEN